MTTSTRELLLGYLMGSLDDADREIVEKQLSQDPSLQRKLEKLDVSLDVLRMDGYDYPPPDGLADEACDFVARQTESDAVSAKHSVGLPPAPVSRARGNSWSLSDLIVAGGVVAATALLFFPAIANSRFHARLATCRNNMRQVGVALTEYSQSNGGYFPRVPARGNLAVAGVYAPTLMENELITGQQFFLCPSSELAEQPGRFRIPTLAEMRSASGRQLARLQRLAGGSLGYNLGHFADGEYHGTRNQSRPYFALISDTPSVNLAGHQSANHGGSGQNFLLEDGSVRYLKNCRLGDCSDDNFFVSDRGFVEAGAHPDDSVLGHSASSPIPWAVPVRVQD